MLIYGAQSLGTDCGLMHSTYSKLNLPFLFLHTGI